MVDRVGRVFAAVPLPTEIRAALADRTAGLHIPGRKVPPENWHLTLRFLGWIDQTEYERFLHGMADVEEVGAFRVHLGALGGFPKPRRATVVWVGVEQGSEGLERLNRVCEQAAQGIGLDAEERPYRPHLTLARVHPPADISDLVEVDVDIGWRCDQVVVYRSHLGRGGARYEPLETFPLSR